MRRWPKVITALVLIMALYDLAYLAQYSRRSFDSESVFGDFSAFYAFANFAMQRSAETIYDIGALQAFEQSLPNAVTGFYPYPYPPTFLLLLLPLAWFSYLAAYCIWIVTTLGAYVLAVAGRDWRSPRLWVALCAPTTLLGIVAGQNGFLTGALLVGGFRIVGSNPIAAGALLGGLAFKPQLFVLLPIALLASRQWRALAGMALSASGMALLSVAVFGWRIWVNWLAAIPGLLKLFAANSAALDHLIPTVTASMIEAGFSPAAARIVQAASTLCAIAVLCLLFGWKAKPPAAARTMDAATRAMDAAALQVAAFLATPYAFIYDMPMVTAALITTVDDGLATRRPWRQGEMLVLLAALLLPLMMVSGAFDGLLVGPLILWPAFVYISRAAWFRPASACAGVPV